MKWPNVTFCYRTKILKYIQHLVNITRSYFTDCFIPLKYKYVLFKWIMGLLKIFLRSQYYKVLFFFPI